MPAYVTATGSRMPGRQSLLTKMVASALVCRALTKVTQALAATSAEAARGTTAMDPTAAMPKHILQHKAIVR